MFCGPTRPRAARRPPFVRDQVPAHEHRLPPQVAKLGCGELSRPETCSSVEACNR